LTAEVANAIIRPATAYWGRITVLSGEGAAEPAKTPGCD